MRSDPGMNMGTGADEHDPYREAKIARLQSAHRGRHRVFILVLLVAFTTFVTWASVFRIDEIARASGEVVTHSRVQIIESVDGGVLKELLVRAGDRVEPGQVLARLDPTRFASAVAETRARLHALEAKAARLRAEVLGQDELTLPDELVKNAPETARIEKALFRQRRIGLTEELRTLQVAVDLAKRKLSLVQELYDNGDASGSELLRAERSLNQAEAKLINRRNQFLEQARLELTKTDGEIAQIKQLLIRRRAEMANTIFRAIAPGIVKNVRVTTIGGVLRPGEELMQIVPLEDELFIEAKVRPADISRVQTGQKASIRFAAFDYTLYGTVPGTVTYVSADTLKEESQGGTEVYYLVHIEPDRIPVRTTTGKTLEIVPGMTAQVDIRAGERTLMDFLLKPVRTTLSNSFGER